MPQMNRGGKFIFGVSVIGRDGLVQLPPQAVEEYSIDAEGRVYLFTGSRSTGGFCVTRRGLLLPSKLGHILTETPELLNYAAPAGRFIPYKGRAYCWVEISEGGAVRLTGEMLAFLHLTPGMRLLSIRSSDIAFTMGLETTAEELERLLGIIHELEPAGIGARDLRECLLLQMAQMPVNTRPRRLARKILTSYFDEFVKKHYEKLMARLQISEADFRDAIAEIRHLSPKPGNLYAEGGTDTTPYIIPDFILDYQDGRFSLSLNSYNVPEVRVNRRYMEMIREMVGSDGRVREKDKEAIQFVKSKIDSAKWFISAIKQRHDTLMRTMQTILDYQQEYFKDGDKSKLRPMILKDIADRTGLDVSTISRVVNSKYVQTQFGIILLKSLFSEAMQTDSGEEVSSYEIKNILQQCIDEEDKRRPLTDETLMDILNSKGYRIARRTVAKYREMLGIPVARLRKQI